MEKLALNPEILHVQSFTTSTETREDERIDPPNAVATRPHVCDPLTAWC